MPNTNSPFVAAIVTAGAWHQQPTNEGGRVRNISGQFEVLTADWDAVADTITIAVLPSHARPLSIMIGNDDMDTNATETVAYDLGVYTWTPPATLGAALDANCFVTIGNQFEDAARLTENIDEAGVGATALIGARLWEWGLATVDPLGFIAIVATMTTVPATVVATQTLSYVVLYTVD